MEKRWTDCRLKFDVQSQACHRSLLRSVAMADWLIVGLNDGAVVYAWSRHKPAIRNDLPSGGIAIAGITSIAIANHLILNHFAALCVRIVNSCSIVVDIGWHVGTRRVTAFAVGSGIACLLAVHVATTSTQTRERTRCWLIAAARIGRRCNPIRRVRRSAGATSSPTTKQEILHSRASTSRNQ